MTDRSRANTVRPRGKATRFAAVALAGALTLSAALPARAQGLRIIRDAEIEQLLRDYTQPLLKVAGLSQQNIQVVIINDRSFNAFVMDGRRIFVNAGALMESATPNQIIGVLAHETGHISGGHLSRLREQLRNAQTQSIIAMLLGLGAMAAGARSSGGDGTGGMAAILGPQMAIQRSLLSYQRSQEEQADRAGVRFLAATGQSPRGMTETFKRMADQSLYAARGADPYMQSHPMPAERTRSLEELSKGAPHLDKKDLPELQLRHDLARAKLSGFLDRADSVGRRYPSAETGLPARYARAIATYRHGDLRSAIAQIDGLIAAQPNNPYFHELKGQAYLEGGRAADAVAPLRRAVALSSTPALIQVMLAQALNGTSEAKYADETIRLLNTALARDSDIGDAHAALAIAYGKKGDVAQADLASAQAAFTRGDFKTARELASRAKTRLAVGSPGWVKADDIATFTPPKRPGS